jgi:hypothetical protein
MQNEIPDYFELIKDYFLSEFSMLIDKNRQEIINRILDSIHSKTENNTSKIFVLEITIENSISKRKIHLSFTEGLNAKGTKSNHITLKIENTSKKFLFDRAYFSIGDFCEFYKIGLSESSFYETTEANYSLEKFKNYIDAVKTIIENSILQQIIEGKIWIDIPINMKPYK